MVSATFSWPIWVTTTPLPDLTPSTPCRSEHRMASLTTVLDTPKLLADLTLGWEAVAGPELLGHDHLKELAGHTSLQPNCRLRPG